MRIVYAAIVGTLLVGTFATVRSLAQEPSDEVRTGTMRPVIRAARMPPRR